MNNPRSVEFAPAAFRDLAALDGRLARTLLDEAECLAARVWPGPPKVKKLEGAGGLFRLRVGDYRMIFERTAASVVVLRVVHRRDLERILRRL